MQIQRVYPEQKASNFWKRNRQDILRSAFLFAGNACLFINLFAGGMPWSLIVIGGLGVIWIAFIYRPLVENTLIKKLTDVTIVVCLYLLLLDMVLGGEWSTLVVPIVLFADLAAIGSFYLLFFKKEKRNFMPLFELLLGGLIVVLLTLATDHTLGWPLIVLGSVSFGMLVLSFILFPKQIALEIRKKLHI